MSGWAKADIDNANTIRTASNIEVFFKILPPVYSSLG